MDSAIEISSDSDVEIQETRTSVPLPHPPQGYIFSHLTNCYLLLY